MAEITKTTPEQNKAHVMEAFDTLFNKSRLCCGRTILVAGLHSHALISHLSLRVCSISSERPDNVEVRTGNDCGRGRLVMVHGRFSNLGSL